MTNHNINSQLKNIKNILEELLFELSFKANPNPMSALIEDGSLAEYLHDSKQKEDLLTFNEFISSVSKLLCEDVMPNEKKGMSQIEYFIEKLEHFCNGDTAEFIFLLNKPINKPIKEVFEKHINYLLDLQKRYDISQVRLIGSDESVNADNQNSSEYIIPAKQPLADSASITSQKINPLLEEVKKIESPSLLKIMSVLVDEGLDKAISLLIRSPIKNRHSLLKKICKQVTLYDASKLRKEYGDLVGRLLQDPSMVNPKILNKKTAATIRMLIDAEDKVVVDSRSDLIKKLFEFVDLKVFKSSHIMLGDHKSFLLADGYLSIDLYKKMNSIALEGRTWGKLNIIEKYAIRVREKQLQKMVAHAFDLDGQSSAHPEMIAREEGTFKLQGQASYDGIFQLQDHLREYVRSTQCNSSLAFKQAVDTFLKIEMDLVNNCQATTFEEDENIAPYVLTLPNHLANVMVAGKYFYKCNRGNRAEDGKRKVPAGVEVFEIAEGQEAKLISHLNKIKNKIISYQELESIRRRFQCMRKFTLHTKEQSVGNCTYASPKLLILSLTFHNHLTNDSLSFKNALALATRDYMDFVNFDRQHALDIYRRESLNPNKDFLKKVDARNIELVKKQVAYLDAMSADNAKEALTALDQTVLPSAGYKAMHYELFKRRTKPNSQENRTGNQNNNRNDIRNSGEKKFSLTASRLIS